MKESEPVRTGSDGPRGTSALIVCGDKFLQVVDSNDASVGLGARVVWADVKRVIAFKRDLLMTDLVCLVFELTNGQGIEVNEEMEGWDQLLADLPRVLPGALGRDGLLASVVKPAFATNETVVYAQNPSHAV